jgi:predicted DNA-binding protein (UPF0251 family)
MRRGRRRRGRHGRIPKPVFIDHTSNITCFKPEPTEYGPPIHLDPDELEVLRLLDMEDLSQEEAGNRMGISRGTIWRVQKRARIKIIQALIEGRKLFLTKQNIEDEKSLE